MNLLRSSATTICALALAIGAVMGLGVAYATSSPEAPSTPTTTLAPASMTFARADLDALLDAANYAAHCGGYVLIDRDDQEVLVSDCDR